MSAAVIDLTDLTLFAEGDPHDAWAWLREHRPVHWNPSPDGGFWALTRYHDIAAAYLDAAAFSSRQGTVLGGSYRSDSDTASGRMLIASDAPAHRHLRKAVHQGFLSAVMEHAARVVREYLDAALNRIRRDGGGDFALDVAPELPAGFLAAMFGIGRDEALALMRLTRSMIGFRDAEYTNDVGETATLVGSQVEIFDTMADLIERRRRSPGTDLVSLLLKSTINGRPMTESEMLYNCLNVAVGGNETTPFTASAALLTLIEHPDEYRLMCADPAVMSSALDEVFRWTSTNAYVRRTATRDIELHGELIRAGDSVTLWNASANRDAAAFSHAQRFDVRRAPNHHLAFGAGPHRCIGMNAARLEISILLEELTRRDLRFELTAEPRRLRSNFMLGFTHMPVKVI